MHHAQSNNNIEMSSQGSSAPKNTAASNNGKSSNELVDVSQESGSVQHDGSASKMNVKDIRREESVGSGSTGFSARAKRVESFDAHSESNLTLVFDDVTVTRVKNTPILANATGLIKSGRVTAIVNCSGSSHADFFLLNILAGEEEAANNTGTVLCNGTPVLAPSFRQRRALLDEDFTMFENLTVRQNLEYAAAMRVAGDTKTLTVAEIMAELLLEPMQDTKVKNCSLYARRRVSLGKELLLNPSAIFFDQALQGLPTHEAQHFLGLLRHIARPSSSRDAVDATSATPERAVAGSASPVDLKKTAEEFYPARSIIKSWNTTEFATPDIAEVDDDPVNYNSPQGSPKSSKRMGSSPGSVSIPVFPVDRVSGGAFDAALDSEVSAARRNERIVVLSMIQPRWALLKLVDDVILLEGTTCVFCGSLREFLLVISRHIDFGMLSNAGSPTGSGTLPLVPPVDRKDSNSVITALLGSPGLVERSINALYRMSTSNAGQQLISPVADKERQQRDGREVVDGLAGTTFPSTTPLYRVLQVSGNATRVHRKVDNFLQECASGYLTLDSYPPSPPNPLVQLLYLCKYALLQVRSNLIVYGSMFVILTLLALTLTAIYTSQEGQSGMQNRIGIMFFLVSCTVLHAILSVETRRKEYLSFQRHRTHGYHSTFVYLCFLVISVAVVRILICSSFTFLVFIISNLGRGWLYYSQAMELALIVGILSFCSYFAVFFVVSVTRTLRLAMFILFALYTLNLVLAGLILNLNTLPKVIRALSFASIIRLAYESAILTQFIDDKFGCETDSSDSRSASKLVVVETRNRAGLSSVNFDLKAHTDCYTGAEYADFLGFDPAREWVNVGVLGGISAGFVLLCFVALLLYRPLRNLTL